VSSARTPDEISAEIAETRTRLAGTIDQLVYRTHPKTIATRQAHSAKAAFINADGSPRVDRIAIAAGVVVGFVGLIVAIRKIVG
jgi:Protein of unknown function (DUF3618)